MMGDGILRAIVRDLRHAVRGAIRRPAYSVPVIATLAIGIGANTAIFSVFNWILFRPVPGVARPGELVTIRFVPPSASGARFFVSYRDIADLRSGMPALSGLAAAAPLSMNVRFENAAEPERVEGEVVTANFFDLLDASPREGRRFHADEERPGSLTPAAIHRERSWRSSVSLEMSVSVRSPTNRNPTCTGQDNRCGAASRSARHDRSPTPPPRSARSALVIAASLLPARRAMRVDPMRSLRVD